MNLEQLYKLLVQQGLQIPFEEFAKLPKEQIQQLAEQVQGQAESPQEQQSGGQEEQMEQPQQMQQQPQMKYGGRMKYQWSGFLGSNTNPNNSTNTNGTGFLANNPNNPLSGMNGGAGNMSGLTNSIGNGMSKDSDFNTNTNANSNTANGNTTSKYSGLGNIAGQFGAGIAQTAGNVIATNSKADQPGAFAGNMLSGAGQGAAAGMAFGPVGAAIGGGLGLVSGLFKSVGDKKNYLQSIKDRKNDQVRHLGSLTNSYNPELRRGGYINHNPGTLSTSSMGVKRQGGSTQPFWNETRKYQVGGTTPNLQSNDDGSADAEIEGGEAVIGNPQDVTMYGGASAEHSSPVGFMANGANHGQENEGGSEGIPLMSNSELYIGSKKLGVNGKNAKRGNPSVATVMKPYLKYAAKAEDTRDLYKRNPQALNAIQNELSTIQQMAEEGKFMENLRKQLSSKDRNYQQVIDYIKQENPNDFGNPSQEDNGQQTPQQEATPQELPQGKYGIHIKPSHKGLFTGKANAAGQGVQEYAHNVMNNSNNPTLRKQANFAINASRFKHSMGGYNRMKYQDGDLYNYNLATDDYTTTDPSVQIIDNRNSYSNKFANNGHEPYTPPVLPNYDNYFDNRKRTPNPTEQEAAATRRLMNEQRYDNAVNMGREVKEATAKENARRLEANGRYNDVMDMKNFQKQFFPKSSMGKSKPVTRAYGGRVKYQVGGEENGTPLKQSFHDRMQAEQQGNNLPYTDVTETRVERPIHGLSAKPIQGYEPNPTYGLKQYHSNGNTNLDNRQYVQSSKNNGAYSYINNASNHGLSEHDAVDRKLRESMKPGTSQEFIDNMSSYDTDYNPNAKVLGHYKNEGDFDITRNETINKPGSENYDINNKYKYVKGQEESKSSKSHDSLANAEMADPNNAFQKWTKLRTRSLYNPNSQSQSRQEPITTDQYGKQKFSDEVVSDWKKMGYTDNQINRWSNIPRHQLLDDSEFKEAFAKDYAQQTGTNIKNRETNYVTTADELVNRFRGGQSTGHQEIDNMIRDNNFNLSDAQKNYISGLAEKGNIKHGNIKSTSKSGLTDIDIEHDYDTNKPGFDKTTTYGQGNTMTKAKAFQWATEQGMPEFEWTDPQTGITSKIATKHSPNYNKLKSNPGYKPGNYVGKGDAQGIIGKQSSPNTIDRQYNQSNTPKAVHKQTYNSKALNQKADGGHLNLGQRVRFAHGGRMYNGTVNYYNPQTGDFDIE